jgi:hypothetical protein
MAASFKIPTSLKIKAKKEPELPKFETLSGNFSKKKRSWVAVLWVRIPIVPIGKQKE